MAQCRSLTSFNCFLKPIRISWSNFYQLMLTLRTHDIMILKMNLARKEKMMKWLFQTTAIAIELTSSFESHCAKSVQIRIFFLSVFSCIRTDYEDLLVSFRIQSKNSKMRTRKNSVFGHFSCNVRILTYFCFQFWFEVWLQIKI